MAPNEACIPGPSGRWVGVGCGGEVEKLTQECKAGDGGEAN